MVKRKYEPEELFDLVLQRNGCSHPSWVGRSEVAGLLRTAKELEIEHEFVAWMLEHRLRFGVRKDLRAQETFNDEVKNESTH